MASPTSTAAPLTTPTVASLMLCYRWCGRSSLWRRSCNNGRVHLGCNTCSHLSIHLGSGVLGTISYYVTRLAAFVACLASCVQRSPVGRGAVARDMPELSTGIALHSLSLAVAGEVVRPSAFVTHGRTTTTCANESPSHSCATNEASTAWCRSSAAHTSHARCWTISL